MKLFDGWAKRFAEEGGDCKVALGVKPGPDGYEIVLCMPEDVPLVVVLDLLTAAAVFLHEGKTHSEERPGGTTADVYEPPDWLSDR